ncbi:MAG: F0F1 ATP synthase subunit delta [Bacteroidales bacterium]|nr:F0F1 ATP synthase subunit delta [Bacteroidales bacterium]
MDNGKISVRYARALLSTAIEQHCETEVYQQLVSLTSNYGLAIQQFNEALSNPMIDSQKKIALLNAAIGEPVHPCLAHFLEFVTEKKRESRILLIALKYQEMYREEKRLLRADVTTAIEPDEKALENIRNYVQQTFHCDTELHVKIDPTIIGGFILDIEHDRMDASIKGRLEKLKVDNGKWNNN